MPKRINDEGLLIRMTRQAERRTIESVLFREDVTSLSQAARLLGIHSATLTKLMQKLGIENPMKGET